MQALLTNQTYREWERNCRPHLTVHRTNCLKEPIGVLVLTNFTIFVLCAFRQRRFDVLKIVLHHNAP